jgi:hypothetical protein
LRRAPDSFKVAEAVEKIATEVGNVASGFRQAHVLTQTKAEHESEISGMFDETRARAENGSDAPVEGGEQAE